MPLNTQILRDGESRQMPKGWSGFHVAAMVIAASIDSGKGPYEDNAAASREALDLMEKQGKIGVSPRDAFDLTNYAVIGMTPLNTGPYTMTQRLVFVDITDGEELELLPGDVLKAWRS